METTQEYKDIFSLFFYESLDAQVLLDIEANKFIFCNEKVYETVRIYP